MERETGGGGNRGGHRASVARPVSGCKALVFGPSLNRHPGLDPGSTSFISDANKVDAGSSPA
jgi:hypothetical protein